MVGVFPHKRGIFLPYRGVQNMGQSRKCLVTDDYVETPVRRLWTILRYPRDCPSAVEQLCLLGRLLKLDTGGDMAV